MSFHYTKDEAGIVTVVMDMAGQSANTMNQAFAPLLRGTLARLQQEDGLRGVIITSAKKTFFAGGDLFELLKVKVADQAYLDYLNDTKGLPVALEGRSYRAADALALGLVDQIVEDPEALLTAARAACLSGAVPADQPWDRKGFTFPGGGADGPGPRAVAQMAPARLFSQTRGKSPAPAVILDVAVNSMRMGFDAALLAETRGFCRLVAAPQAKSAIRTNFIGMTALKAGKFRPGGAVSWQPARAEVIGAGRMGAGIAWAQAACGLVTLLRDRDVETAQRGRALSEKRAARAVQKGQMQAAEVEQLLSCIQTTAQPGAAAVDIILEAVPEDIDLKMNIIADSFARLSPTGTYGTNTSTLPIAELARACPDPSRFIGIHFFSPVEKMQLVELIVGPQTSEETVKKAWEYCRRIGKLPIIVNDSRGFFTSRVFSACLDEAQALLRDGVAPAAIERAAWSAGLPVGPLAVMDDVSLTLLGQICASNDLLDQRLPHMPYRLATPNTRQVALDLLARGRGGKQAGGGFYDYHPDGSKTFWDGLAGYAAGKDPQAGDDAQDRLLYRQVVEALRCLDEGVLRSQVEGNIGSILAIGFPAWTGGVFELIAQTGPARFAARCDQLAARYGARFVPPPGAVERAALNAAA